MAYDDTLPDNQNWVRFLMGDTSASPTFSDEEIDAVLSDEEVAGKATKYFVAAALLETRIVELTLQGVGVKRKKVGETETEFGIAGMSIKDLQSLSCRLRARGARLNRQRPLAIRAYRTAQQLNDWR